MISFAVAWVLVTMVKQGKNVSEFEMFLVTGIFDVIIFVIIAVALTSIFSTSC